MKRKTAEPVWLTLDEASARLGVPRSTIMRWLHRKTNRLPSRLGQRDGHSVRVISQTDLDNYKRPQMGGKR